MLAWKPRNRQEAGQEVYWAGAATGTAVNAQLHCYRGRRQMTARGLPNMKCVAISCALAYNVMHCGAALLKAAS
ncbi:MAG: hypothetical protein ACE14L_16870 [Terriglobales bacterium]